MCMWETGRVCVRQREEEGERAMRTVISINSYFHSHSVLQSTNIRCLCMSKLSQQHISVASHWQNFTLHCSKIVLTVDVVSGKCVLRLVFPPSPWFHSTIVCLFGAELSIDGLCVGVHCTAFMFRFAIECLKVWNSISLAIRNTEQSCCLRWRCWWWRCLRTGDECCSFCMFFRLFTFTRNNEI